MKSNILEQNNDSRKRVVNIGLESVAVAVARVTERPPRCSNKRDKSVDVYKTLARIILFVNNEARSEKILPPPINAPEPHRPSSVWGKYDYNVSNTTLAPQF